MSADPEDPESVPDEPAEPEAETDWQRRQRLAAVFGDVLPETTSDERDQSESGTSDAWLKRQVPPHHG
jgi:hypothetical protein